MENEPISIIIPVYNEEKAIAQTIQDIKECMAPYGYELIVVDDCSKDGSYDMLSKISGIRLVKHKVNKGYGASLKSGISASKYGWIFIIDADGTYPAKDMPKFLEYMPDNDLIIGARVGKIVKIPLLRRPAKFILTKIATYIASKKVVDLNSGMMLFKKSMSLKFWNLYPERFSFTSTNTMIAFTNDYDVKFMPINYYKREGKSTINPIKDFIEFNKLLLKLCLFFRPLKIFVPFSILLFLIGLAIVITGLLKLGTFFDITFVMLSLASIQIFILGLIAELIIRTKNQNFK
ncbi:glycosyltransferase family 2 protein [Candidatus Woesearchaeota archaeon]|nr:glycosyltransferase family 2 protein [Candidatus Woesearchaeota archaeon]